MKCNKPELLAPCGDQDAFKARFFGSSYLNELRAKLTLSLVEGFQFTPSELVAVPSKKGDPLCKLVEVFALKRGLKE